VLSIYLATVIGALTIFYSILVVSLFVPILGGLYTSRAGAPEAIASIVTGLVTLFAVRLFLTPAYRVVDPALTGVIAAGVAYFFAGFVRRAPADGRPVHTR
jgi:Na+/proline symporter